MPVHIRLVEGLETPWELNLIMAARYLHVAPWELIEQSAYWLHLAIAANEAETRARNIIRRNAERKKQ